MLISTRRSPQVGDRKSLPESPLFGSVSRDAGQRYKLAPTHLAAEDLCVDRGNPSAVLPYRAVPDAATADLLAAPTLLVANPHCDRVDPALVTMYVTNTGPHTPSYVYRLLSELYAPEDHDLN